MESSGDDEIIVQVGLADVAGTYDGEALLWLGRDDEARQMLTSAQQLDRLPLELYRLLGKLYMREKNYPAAICTLSHYVSLRKDDATAYYLLSRAYGSMGDSEQSKRALAQFVKASRDEKTRNRARKEMEAFSRPGLQADVTDSTDLNSK